MNDWTVIKKYTKKKRTVIKSVCSFFFGFRQLYNIFSLSKKNSIYLGQNFHYFYFKLLKFERIIFNSSNVKKF